MGSWPGGAVAGGTVTESEKFPSAEGRAAAAAAAKSRSRSGRSGREEEKRKWLRSARPMSVWSCD